MNSPKSVQKISDLIGRIYPELDAIGHDYCIIGSAALALSGIVTPVHDLDILTSSRSAQKLVTFWAARREHSYLPESSERFRSDFARFVFDELPVEVMGGLEVNSAGQWKKVEVQQLNQIEVKGKIINVPTLEEQVRIFELLGRSKDLDKIKLIENFTAEARRRKGVR